MRSSVLSLRRWLVAPLVLAVTVCAWAGQRNFHIPAQDLTVALESFAKQADTEVLFDRDQTRGRQSSSISGELEPLSALKALLGENSLLIRQVNERTFIIGDVRSVRETLKLTQVSMDNAMAQATTAQARSGAVENAVRNDNSAADTGIPEMLVTGSKVLNMDIARSRDDTQPYVIFNREQIQNSQATSLEDFLKQRLTMNTQSNLGTQLNTINGNTSQINLRGLGANQTLILIDGHRAAGVAVFGTLGQADINWIPMGAVERIEVLPTTASGIFGGSATGGAINIIMRRDYSGAEIDMNYENTFDTDAALRRVQLSGGFSLEDGKTNVLLSASYSDANRLAVRDRDYLRRGRENILRNNPSFILGIANPPLGYTTNIRSTSGANLTLKSNGSSLNSPITFVPVGYTGITSDNGAALAANAGQYNLDPSDTSQTGIGAGAHGLFSLPTVESAMATVRRRFGANVEVFVEGSAANNETMSPTNFANGVYVLPVTAPNNPFQQEIRVTAPLNTTLDSPFASSTYTRRVVGGTIVRLPRDWRAEVDYTWNQTGYKYFNSRNISPQLAADVTSGTLDVMRDMSIAPPNLSGYIGTTNNSIPEALKSTLRNLALRAGGPIFSVPAGKVSLTSLLEWRQDYVSDAYQFITTNTVYRPNRSQDIYSASVEAKIPLISALNRRPGLEELEVQIAARMDEYTINGADAIYILPSPTAPIPPINRKSVTLRSAEPTIGVSFKPLPDVMLRASWGTGFFPPSLSDLVPLPTISPVTSPQSVVDPRRGNQPTIITWDMISAGGGNPNLRPEDSESWSAGVVFTPRLIEGLRLSVDYTRIHKSDNIVDVTYQDAVNYELFIPGRVTRAPVAPGDPYGVGPITSIDVSKANLASTFVEAYDLAADYAFDVGAWGSMEAFFQATVQTHLENQASPVAPVLDAVGIGSANPLKFKANAGLSWKHGQWSANWITRYFDSYLVANPAIASSAPTILNQGNGGRVSDQIYHDISAGYRFAQWRSEFRLGVKNVFNTEPPYDASTSPRYYSYFGDGRLASYWASWKTEF